jgi:5-methylcytosine-specific restriction endonuclease McrA
MIDQSQFNKRTGVIYQSMKNRFRERLWKSGRRAGMVRTPGRDLPFSVDEFRQWARMRIGLTVVLCPYCSAPIDALSFSTDHDVPIKRGGSLELSNLVACCTDCNTLKGELCSTEFRVFLDVMRNFPVPARNDIFKRLRSGAMGARLRHFSSKPKQSPAAVFQSSAGDQPTIF